MGTYALLQAVNWLGQVSGRTLWLKELRPGWFVLGESRGEHTQFGWDWLGDVEHCEGSADSVMAVVVEWAGAINSGVMEASHG